VEGIKQVARIKKFRVSFIWSQTVTGLLEEWPDPAPYTFLGRASDYQKWFSDIRALRNTELNLPWIKETHHFWLYYLEKSKTDSLNLVKEKEAWRALVPFRKQLPTRQFLPPAPNQPPYPRFQAEAFFYPHGLAIVITLNWEGDFELNKLVTEAMAWRWQECYVDSVGNPATLDELAEQFRQEMHAHAFGSLPVENSSDTPFTIATVVEGDRVDPNVKFGVDKTIQPAIDQLVRWDKIGQLPGLPASVIRARQLFLGDALYIGPRGRVIWFPSRFTPLAGGRKKSLSCYHRNLFFTSTQIESLGNFVLKGANRAASETLPTTYRECLKNAVIRLSLLYNMRGDQGGPSGTYRTRSAPRQIKDNNLLEAINSLRARLLTDRGQLPDIPIAGEK